MPSRRRLLLVLTHLALAAGAFALGWGAHRRAASAAASIASEAKTSLPARPAPPGSASKATADATDTPATKPAPDDPAAFVAWAKAIFDNPPLDPFASGGITIDVEAPNDALESLVHRNVEAARQVAELAGQQGLWPLVQTFARAWAADHFADALAWAKIQNGRARTEAFSGLAGAINPENAAEASRTLLPELPRGRVRAEALGEILSRWTERDPVHSFEWLQSLPTADVISALTSTNIGDPFAQNNTFRDLLKASPQAVAAFVASLPCNQHTFNLMTGAAREMAGSDPSSALEWAHALPTAGARAECFDIIWKQWANTDLKAATTRALAEADPQARQCAIESIAHHVADGGVELEGTVQSWIDSLPADTRLTAEGKSLMRQKNPSMAAERLARLLTGADASAEPLRKAAGEIASEFAEDSPTQAAEWIVRLPGGAVQAQAASGVASAWCENDPVAASEWVARLPAGEARDGAAAGLASALASSDPEAAFQWAESIGTAGTRAQALRSALESWKAIDPAAARQAIEASTLASAEKSPLIDELEAP